MSYTGQVRFSDEHDDRTRPQSNHRGGFRGRGNQRGQYNNRGGFRGNNRGRGNQQHRGGGGRGFRRGAQDAIAGKFRGRGGDWKSRQAQERNERNKPALLDDDDDDAMGGTMDNSGSRPGRFYTRGSGKIMRGGNVRQTWYKVNVPYGVKSDKKFILESLNELMDVPFQPTNYHIVGQNAVFFVQDRRVSEAIRACSKRIKNKNGFPIVFQTQPSKPPMTNLDDNAIEKIKVAMSNRYTPEVKALDLSDFHNDEQLNNEGVYPVMYRQVTIEAIANIIGEHIPEVECLLLSRNRLSDLRILSDLVEKAPHVIKIDLSENNINHEGELSKIKDMKLVEMKLDKNPLKKKFKEESMYVSCVRKLFPKLMKLDGHELPPPIHFAVETTTELPASQGSFFLSDAAKDVVLVFLEEYFRIYDSDDRQKLMDAYHEQSYFSMSSFQNKSFASRQAPLNEYIHDSRNLKLVKDTTRQQKQLMSGKLRIVALLNQLPKTQHDASTISVDITLATPAMMLFTVTGVFKETSGKNPAMRAFSRVFITVPQGSGIVIINEQLTITNPSPDLTAKSFKDPAPTPAPSPVQTPSVSLPVVPSSQSPADLQEEMIKQFSQKSGMTAEWSAKCLAHNGWDYDRSAKVFTEMMAKNQIPPEAFTNFASP